MSESFFEKLKKGMGTEEPAEGEAHPLGRQIEEPEKEVKEKPKIVPKSKKIKEFKIETKPIELEAEKTELEGEKPPFEALAKKDKEKWFKSEGQLMIDVYQTEDELVIRSAIAGVKPEDLDILIEGDVLTIKGNRQKPFDEKTDYFIQECYWGPFSREVILPVEADPGRVEASMNEGVLTIKLPKIEREKKKKIIVKR